jgi:glycosyltransferase involved in cell wall biosynthesis
MNILMISPVDPYPANSGGKVRIKQIYDGLNKHHEVLLAAPCSDRRNSYYDPKTARRRKIHRNLSLQPYHFELWYDRALEMQISHVMKNNQFDLIYCHFIYTVPYVLNVNLPVLVDQHNVDRVYWLRKANAYLKKKKIMEALVSQINYFKVIRFEKKMFPFVDGVISVSSADKKKMVDLFGKSRELDFIVAPNGVDTYHYHPQTSKPAERDSISIGFLGSLDLELNVDAANTLCEEILPRLQERFPAKNIKALVIGKNPPDDFVTRLKNNKNITITGLVPDLLPYLHQVDIMVFPLQYGAGTKVRVFETAASGIPIVATSMAMDGIDDLQPREHYGLGNSVDELVFEICDLIDHPEKRSNMACKAHQIITRKYDWGNISNHLAAEIARYKNDR